MTRYKRWQQKGREGVICLLGNTAIKEKGEENNDKN